MLSVLVTVTFTLTPFQCHARGTLISLLNKYFLAPGICICELYKYRCICVCDHFIYKMLNYIPRRVQTGATG